MRTSPAQLIVAALVAALFGLAGAASRTCGPVPAHAMSSPAMASDEQQSAKK